MKFLIVGLFKIKILQQTFAILFFFNLYWHRQALMIKQGKFHNSVNVYITHYQYLCVIVVG